MDVEQTAASSGLPDEKLTAASSGLPDEELMAVSSGSPDEELTAASSGLPDTGFSTATPRLLDMERLSVYLDSLDGEDSPLVETIRKEALAAGVPIVRRETAALLRVLTVLRAPGQILEIGTGVGYSALLMAEYAPEDCAVTTIEKYEKRIPVARENIRRAGRENQITLLEGDAARLLLGLQGRFDFIFMDAAKGQYIRFLEELLRLLAPGGVLVSDNVLQDGTVLESRFAVERRDRTIHSRMREYLYELKHRPELVTAIVPVGDGVALSVRRPLR